MKSNLLLALLISICGLTQAQNFSLSAKSGDAERDASLNDINLKAKADINLFKKNLSIEFNVGEAKIEKMLTAQVSPADVYMTVQVANMVKKDPDVVLNTYNQHKDKGWGAIAKEMGIKPGSAEFHALKNQAKNRKGGNGNGNGNGNGKGNGNGNGHGHD